MLATNCPARKSKDGKVFLHTFELHCNSVWIIAEFTLNEDEEYSYRILGRKYENTNTDHEMYSWVDEITREYMIEWAN